VVSLCSLQKSGRVRLLQGPVKGEWA